MGFIFFALVVAAIVLALRRLGMFEPGPVFEMVFEAGRLSAQAGPVPSRIRASLLDVAELDGVTGTLTYFGPGEYTFSDEVSEGSQQRFRNVLALTFPLPSAPGGGSRTAR